MLTETVAGRTYDYSHNVGRGSATGMGFANPVALVVLGRNNPSLYTVNGRPLYVHLNGLAIVLLK
jgi:hypothetical protein